MKNTILLTLLLMVTLGLRAQEITLDKVPVAVQEKFKADHSDIPAYVKPTWYHDKAVGSDRALFKVSYMVTGGFETYLYSHSGQEVYRIKDYYNPANAPQTVVNNMKAAYTASSPAKVSEYSSTKYNMKGYNVTFQDYKSRYADASGALSTENPARTFSQKADADLSNFTAAPSSPAASGTAPTTPAAPVTPGSKTATEAPAAPSTPANTTVPASPKASPKSPSKAVSPK
jgi:hypothetical protein